MAEEDSGDVPWAHVQEALGKDKWKEIPLTKDNTNLVYNEIDSECLRSFKKEVLCVNSRLKEKGVCDRYELQKAYSYGASAKHDDAELDLADLMKLQSLKEIKMSG
eukprot:Nk52_evm7s292 gene=Nk52_evmTU7s292